VTEDLNLLTADLIATFIHPYANADIGNFSVVNPPVDPDRPIITFAEHLRKTQQDSLIHIIRDEDIQNGYIFDARGFVVDSDSSSEKTDGDKSNNIYDMLILFHDEYATRAMYDNYRRFVSNGGTMLFLDANVFIAEVDHDKENQTINFVRGHDWEFVNGTFARKSVLERWFNENKEWMGSNFLTSDITGNIIFANNPFNYTHFEENYVNNPNVKILIDYGVVLPKKCSHAKFPVATYLLKYGNGNTVIIGLYGQQLFKNQEFINFLDTLVDNSLA
jgi:hypothetical protein